MISKVDKWNIGKLETTTIDWSKLSGEVKNEVVKKTEYNELVKKVDNINHMIDCNQHCTVNGVIF